MPFPFPIIPGNNNVSFPFPKFGNRISIPVPVPNNWEWNFHSRSHSQKLGMQFVIPIPVPKLWEWVELFPFPFPKSQKSFPLTPAGEGLNGLKPPSHMYWDKPPSHMYWDNNFYSSKNLLKIDFSQVTIQVTDCLWPLAMCYIHCASNAYSRWWSLT